MKTRIICCSLAVVATTASFGQLTDPQAALDKIMMFQERQIAHESRGHEIDEVRIEKQMKQMALNALRGISATKIDPKMGFTWANLYYIAKDHKTACMLTNEFLTTSPKPRQQFSARMFLIANYSALGNTDMVVSTLRQTKPTDESQTMMLEEESIGAFADTIAKAKGPMVAYGALKAAHQNAADQFHLIVQSGDARSRRVQSMELGFISREADLLAQAGHRKQALQLVDAFAESLPTNSKLLPAVRSQRAKLRG